MQCVMKFKNNHVGFLLAGLITILLKCALQAQVNTNLEFRAETPHTSYAQVCHSNTCNQGYSSDRDEGEALTDKIKAIFPVAVSSKGNVSIDADIISGIITCGDVNCAGDGSYRREIYVDAVPGIDVRVRFQSTSQTTGTGWAKFTYSGTEHTLTNGTSQWSEIVKPSTYKTILVGEKTYYWLGTLVLQAGAGGGAGSNGSVVSAQISNIRANYIGNVLSIDDGNNQTWMVNKQLPKPLNVIVLDGETSAPKKTIQIAYTIFPSRGAQFPGGGSLAYASTGQNGIATMPLILGNLDGVYRIVASCVHANDCASGVKEVWFTENAVTAQQVTELSVVQCESYAAINTPVRNSFVVRAFNTLTHKGEPNWTINFDKEAFPAGATGQKALPASVITDPLGIGFGTMWTGDKVGGYTYRAVCPSCLMNPQVWCSVLAALPPKVEAVPLDDGPEAGDPGVTPMLRISNIYYLNDGVSFTTHDGEKTVTLEAELRPTDTALASNIAWVVEDSERDAMISGNPDDPAPGESTAFDVTAPTANTGRLLPLKYKIQSSVMTPKGLVRSYPRHIKQDDIDKCRQEYFDLSTAEYDLKSPGYFGKYTRPKFSPGTDGEFVKYSDCYAHIYPQARAQEALSMRDYFRGQFGVTVTSGYRSARHNKREGGVPNSVHMFGEAVDIQSDPVNGPNMRKLWLQAGCPKILERMVSVTGSDGRRRQTFEQMLDGKCDGTGLVDWQNNSIEGVFTSNFDNIQKGRKNTNGDNNFYDILEDINPRDGIADIFNEARVVHLGD